jgi:Rrf2 family nitric oxide-sensitive transcriptional repressor
MISQTSEYALRAIVWLADHSSKPQTTHDIAQSTKVPAGYLSKVLQSLGRSQLVQSQRGLHGGFVLARDAESITVLDVINAVDPIRRIESCPLKLESHGTHLCPLHRRIDDAIASIEQAFGDTTIAELLAEPNTSRPLCDVTIDGN